jgi:hypothetical protein
MDEVAFSSVMVVKFDSSKPSSVLPASVDAVLAGTCYADNSSSLSPMPFSSAPGDISRVQAAASILPIEEMSWEETLCKVWGAMSAYHQVRDQGLTFRLKRNSVLFDQG